MQQETHVVWQWFRVNVPTLLSIGGLIWYTATNDASQRHRLEAIENSQKDRAVVTDEKFATIKSDLALVSQRVEPLSNVVYRVTVVEGQVSETNKRIDRFSESIINSLELIRKDLSGISTRIEVLAQKVDTLSPNTPGRRASATPLQSARVID